MTTLRRRDVRQPMKTGLLWLILLVTFLVIYQIVPNGRNNQEITWGNTSYVNNKEIKELKVDGTDITGTTHSDVKFVVYGPIGEDPQQKLADQAAANPKDFRFEYKQVRKTRSSRAFLSLGCPCWCCSSSFSFLCASSSRAGAKRCLLGKARLGCSMKIRRR